MKITKNTLKQLIKEEFARLQEQEFYGDDPEEEGGRQLEVPDPGETRASYGLGGGERGASTTLRLRDIEKAIAGLKTISHHLFKGVAPDNQNRDPQIDALQRAIRSAVGHLDALIDSAARYEIR